MKKLAVLFVIFVACWGFKIPHDDEEVFIRCQFTGSYTCNLYINNPDGIEFDEIEGNHTGVNTNDNVRLVQGLYQNSRNVPSILCESFPNLVEIFLEISNVEVLTTASFFACENIQMLFLGLNAIASIPDGVFATNRNLHTLMLMQNAIQEISINAFNGSQISVLELDHNQLMEIRQEWVESIHGTLEVFTISSNNITESPEGLQLENLRLLDISHNNLGVLQPDFFWGLTSLADLWIDDIGISSIFDGSFEGENFNRNLTENRKISVLLRFNFPSKHPNVPQFPSPTSSQPLQQPQSAWPRRCQSQSPHRAKPQLLQLLDRISLRNHGRFQRNQLRRLANHRAIGQPYLPLPLLELVRESEFLRRD